MEQSGTAVLGPPAPSSRSTDATRRIGRNHAIIVLGSVFENGLGLVGSVLTARMLLPAGRGQLGRWVYWGQLLVSLGALGILTAVPQLVGAGRLPERDARRLATAFGIVVAPLAGLAGLVFVAPALGASGALDGWTCIALGFVPATLVAFAAQAVLIARDDLVTMMAVRVAGRAAYVVVLGALLATGETRPSAAALVLAGQAILIAGGLGGAARPASPSGLSSQLAREALRRGVSNHLPTVAVAAISLLDQGWVFSQLRDADAGFFATSLGAALLVDVLGFAEITASTVAMSDAQAGWRSRRTALSRTTVLGIAVLAVGYLLAPFVIPLVYGKAFTPAVPIFRVLLVGQVLYNLGRVAEAALQSAGRPQVAWLFQATRGAALFTFMGFFGRFAGPIGVATATAAASAAGALATLAAVQRTGIRIRPPIRVTES